MTRAIYFNEDNHHFYGAHPPEDMSVEESCSTSLHVAAANP